MTYKRNYVLKKNKMLPGRPNITDENPSRERPIRRIRFSDEEWDFATQNARQCHMHTGTYIRKLAKARTDIIQLSKRLAGLSDEARKLILGEPEFQMEWFNAVQKELDFIDDLRRRI